MRTLLPAIFLLFFVSIVSAQQPDQWKGLVLDESTPEDAVAKLGEASKPGRILKMIVKGAKKQGKDVQGFNWDNKEGFADVNLYFIDGTLAMIYLEKPKVTMPTVSFVDAYPDLAFYVVTQGSPLGLSSITMNSFEATTPKGKISGITAGGSTYRELGLNGRESKYKPEGSIWAVTFQSNRWLKDPKSIDVLK